MSQHLRDLFEQALDDEPVPPATDLAQQAMRQGRRIRRRRGLMVGGPTAAAAVAVLVALNLSSAPAGPPPPVSAAAVMMAQAEPQCTWPAPAGATDVSIFLRDDVTAAQREALRTALQTDPRVRDLRYESREQAFEKFELLWRDSPDFVESVGVDQLPESFRLKLVRPAQSPAFAAAYQGRAGIEDLVGGICP